MFSSVVLAGASSSGKVPFEMPVVSCNETILVSGWFQVVTNVTNDGAGGLHFVQHFIAKGHGTGLTTGMKYQYNEALRHVVENYTAGGTFAANLVQRTRLISQGPLDNSIFFVTAHITTLPDGTTTVERFDITAECF